MACTPFAFSSGIKALMLSASLRKSSPAALAGEMIPAVAFNVSPMKATGISSKVRIS